MPNTWGIQIGILNGTIVFRPDVSNAQIGQPLGVLRNDLVLWTNRTGVTIALVSTQPPGLFLTNPIPPGQGSRPFFRASDSIAYTAMNAAHFPSQSHAIIVVDPPVA